MTLNMNFKLILHFLTIYSLFLNELHWKMDALKFHGHLSITFSLWIAFETHFFAYVNITVPKAYTAGLLFLEGQLWSIIDKFVHINSSVNMPQAGLEPGTLAIIRGQSYKD